MAGWLLTAGRFDPTVLDAMEALGYDRSFARLTSSAHLPNSAMASTGCSGIVTNRQESTVTLPAGVRLDPGGIGKGLAADLVVAEVVGAGASGVCVNIGGDFRAAGEGPTPQGWPVVLEDPFDQRRELARTAICHGGVATTSRTYRTWERASVQFHHLVDPATGTSAWTDLAAVTVFAGSAWQAEVLAKAAYLAGPAEGPALLQAAGCSGVFVDNGGEAWALPGCEWEVLSTCWQ